MTWRSTRDQLIARLREGPLQVRDYHQVATSRVSLRVRIHQLRKAGFDIQTVYPGRRAHHAREYRLVAEPA